MLIQLKVPQSGTLKQGGSLSIRVDKDDRVLYAESFSRSRCTAEQKESCRYEAWDRKNTDRVCRVVFCVAGLYMGGNV